MTFFTIRSIDEMNEFESRRPVRQCVLTSEGIEDQTADILFQSCGYELGTREFGAFVLTPLDLPWLYFGIRCC